MAAGMTRTLLALPETHPRRAALLDAYRLQMAGLKLRQHASGLWHQLLDHPDSFQETSGTALFVYSMAYGIRQGWLDRAEYEPVVTLAWDALARRIQAHGRVTDIVWGGPSRAWQAVDYTSWPKVDGDNHGQGTVLLAAEAMLRLSAGIVTYNVTYDATGAAEPTAQLLESTLTRLDASLYQESERAVRAELDGLIQQFAEYGIYAPRLKIHDDTITVNLKGGELLHNAARFFQAYEMLNEPRYLRAGLKTADLFLQIQQPRGHFPVRIIVRRGGRVTAEGELWEAPEMIRLQDNIQYPSFCLLLFAHKLTGEAKYFDAAKRCADLVHSLQNPENGSVPDYVGPTKPNFPFPLYWPNAQSDPDLVTTWAGIMNGGSFNDDATTDAFRMSVMMYHLSKDPSYLDRSSKIGQWMFDTQLGEGLVRGWCEQYGPDNQPAWVRWWEGPVIHSRTFQQCVGKMLAWFYAVTGEVRYRTLFEETYNWMRTVETPGDAGGLPRSFLPDGSPVFSHNWKTYRYDRPETWPDPRRMTADELSVWNNDTQPDGGHRVSVQSAPHRAFEKKFDENQKIKQLLDVGGRDALRAWHRGPTQYSHVQYLEARLAAARRVLAREIRGKGLTPWEHVWDYRLAQGWIDAKVAAHGGRGLESYASPRPHWMEQCMEVEDWLDITLGPQSKPRP